MGNCIGKKEENNKKDSELRRLFEQFDLDGDGFIDESELRCVMETMGQSPDENDIRIMFKAADTNNDEKISFEEFTAIASSIVRST